MHFSTIPVAQLNAMLRKIFVLCLFCFVVKGFPSHEEVKGNIIELAEKIADKISDGTSKKDEATKLCRAQFPEVPAYKDDFENRDKMFQAASDNLPGARCFIGCMSKTLDPQIFDSNGEIIIEKIQNNDGQQYTKVKFPMNF